MSRPLDIFDLPDPARCHCGAVEPQSGETFPICLSCDEPVCPAHFNGFRCDDCQANRDANYEPAEDTGHESVGQLEIRELTGRGGRMR